MLNKTFLSSKYGEEQVALILKTQENLSKLSFNGCQNIFEFAEEVANIIINLKLDADSVCAALLFPYAEVARKNSEAAQQINALTTSDKKDVAVLVGSLAKCDELSKNYTDADGLKEMLIAITKDIRVIIIKAAQILVFARHNKDVKNEESEKVFRSIDDIFAPIAARLGLSEIKSELQDLS